MADLHYVCHVTLLSYSSIRTAIVLDHLSTPIAVSSLTVDTDMAQTPGSQTYQYLALLKPTSRSFRFLELPAEVRQLVCGYFFEGSERKYQESREGVFIDRSRHFHLNMICRLIHTEARQVYMQLSKHEIGLVVNDRRFFAAFDNKLSTAKIVSLDLSRESVEPLLPLMTRSLSNLKALRLTAQERISYTGPDLNRDMSNTRQNNSALDQALAQHINLQDLREEDYEITRYGVIRKLAQMKRDLEIYGKFEVL